MVLFNVPTCPGTGINILLCANVRPKIPSMSIRELEPVFVGLENFRKMFSMPGFRASFKTHYSLVP